MEMSYARYSFRTDLHDRRRSQSQTLLVGDVFTNRFEQHHYMVAQNRQT